MGMVDSMMRYRVTFKIEDSGTIDVEARDEKQARELARKIAPMRWGRFVDSLTITAVKKLNAGSKR